MTEARPAFYALAPGGWRDYVTLLHPPYTAWHLSYVAIGACLAPTLYTGRLAAAAVGGTIELRNGSREPVTRETLVAAPERALKVLAAANVALAAALLVLRLA